MDFANEDMTAHTFRSMLFYPIKDDIYIQIDSMTFIYNNKSLTPEKLDLVQQYNIDIKDTFTYSINTIESEYRTNKSSISEIKNKILKPFYEGRNFQPPLEGTRNLA